MAKLQRAAINGPLDPGACARTNSATIHIAIFHIGGAFAGEFAQRCDPFATTIDLYPAQYSATADLRDPAGNPRTTAVSIPPFTVLSGTNLMLDVNFPPSSFF